MNFEEMKKIANTMSIPWALVEMKDEVIEEIETIQDDICLIMNGINERLIFVPRVGKVYDKLSRVWHTLRNIRIDLCLEVGKNHPRYPEIKGQKMTRQDLVAFIRDIVKRTQKLTRKLREMSDLEPKVFDFGVTPSHMTRPYHANNAWLTLEDIVNIINGQ